MLHRLTIQNLITIEDISVGFGPGLNALTGETGAGKSILVEALGLALGDRAAGEPIRAGTRLAVIEAEFLPPFPAALAECAAALELDFEPLEPLTIRREIAAGGRNRCFVNGQMVNVTDLARLGEPLVDFHGQHEHQSLLHKGAAREALDAFGGHEPLRAAYDTAWQEAERLRRRRAELDRIARDFVQRADFLDYQLDELNRIHPAPGELDALAQEERRLAHADALARDAAEAYGLLYEGVDEEHPPLLGTLREVQRRLAALAELEPRFADAPARLEDARTGLVDLADALRDYVDGAPSDPARLNAVIERAERIRALMRKHGGSEAALAAAWEAMRRERDQMELDERERETIDTQAAEAQARLLAAAGKLSAARRKAADRFAREVLAHLKPLNMEKARFEVGLAPLPGPLSHGMDDVDFLLAANPGLPPAPLRKVGSGGELSRVMLALKSVLAARDRVPTLVFDEIDVGLSGDTARRVGTLMETAGASHQLLCITHHAPIAARAAVHLAVSKSARKDSTTTHVTRLEGEARLAELARMMGGQADQPSARKLAEELMA